MEEKLTRVQSHCLAIHTKDKRLNSSKKICICELLSSDRQSAVYMTRHACKRRVSSSLKINLGHCFHHYMVAVCFTRQQKDTKKERKKKKNKNKRTEVKHFVFTCGVTSEIEFSFENSTYLLGKSISLRWLNRVMQDHEARASDLNPKLIFSFFLLFS